MHFCGGGLLMSAYTSVFNSLIHHINRFIRWLRGPLSMAHGMASNGAEFQWICKVLGDSRQAICGKHPAESWISKDAGWIILTLLQAPISPKEIKHKRPSGMYLLHSHDGCSLTLLMDLSSVINEKKHTKLFFAFPHSHHLTNHLNAVVSLSPPLHP